MKKITLFLSVLLCCAISMAQETFVSGGRNRTMIVYAPTDLPQNRPLLISMHGMNQDANYQRNQANYEAVADTAKFVVVYPNGEGNAWDISGTKDINFILDIIDEMHRRYSIDKNRVYLSGFSMGGMMTYHAMTKIADRIAAFAPVSGYPMGGPNATSSRPIPIMHVHGTGDDVCVYSSVQSHLDAWVKRNGCNSTPRTQKPATGPSNTTAEIIRYTNGLEGVEVAHLKLPDKGHWHSNDPAMAMTNREIWNFVSRWSLTPGPELLSVSPEDDSFDLSPTDDRTFTFTFDKPINCSKAKLSLSDGSSGLMTQLAETGFSTTLTFTIAAGKTPKNVEYRTQLTEIYGEDGSKGANHIFHHTYGVQEVGETLRTDTLLAEEWYSQQEAIGEGIPVGWHRINSNADGSKDEKTSGSANTGGARMKYFVPGGDFDAGLYFSSRDYNQATFTYGETAPYTISLTRGRYNLSFRSVYWNDGARNNSINFGCSVIRSSTGASTYSSPSLTPTGCMSEKTDKQITGSKLHELSFEVLTADKYLLQYSIAAGWDGVVLGPPTLTRRPTPAELYKGEFLRTLHKAQAMLALLEGNEDAQYAEQIAKLRGTITKHETLVSTAPSVYEAARLELLEAMLPLQTLSIGSTPTAEVHKGTGLFDLYGRRTESIQKAGLYINNGKKIFIK